MNRQVHYAINFAVYRGWKLFPLLFQDNPALRQPQLLSQATSSVHQIRQWIEQYRGCTWAVATGSQSRILVMELSNNLGIRTVPPISVRDVTAMDTLQSHSINWTKVFFRWPEAGLPAYPNEKCADGIHVRHTGGYVELDYGNGRDSLNQYAPVRKAPEWLLNWINSSLSTPKVLSFQATTPRRCLVRMSISESNGIWTCSFSSVANGRAHLRTWSCQSRNSILKIAARAGWNAESRRWLDSNLKEGLRNTILLPLTEQQLKDLQQAA